MKGCGGQIAQAVGYLLGSDAGNSGGGFADEHVRECRAAGDGGDTALGLKAGCGDAACGVEAHGQAQDVSTDRIGDIHGGGSVWQVARITRIAEVVEDSVVEHREPGSRINNVRARIQDDSRAVLSIMPRARDWILGMAREWIVDRKVVKAVAKSFAFFISMLLTQVGLGI